MGDYTNLSIELTSTVSDDGEAPPAADRTCRPILDPAEILDDAAALPAQRRPRQQGLPEGAQRRRGARSSCARSAPEAEEREQGRLQAAQPDPRPARLPAGTGGGGGLPTSRRRSCPASSACAAGLGDQPATDVGARGPTMGQLMERLRPGAGVAARPGDGGGAMITRRTKIQLLVFVLITLVGVSFVGARYARLDRLVFDDSYTVVAHFPESGGIFAGGEVTYRGVRGRPGRRARAHRRRASTSTSPSRRTTTRSPPTRWRSSATGPRSASSTSSCSRRPTTSPFLEDDSRDRGREHPHADRHRDPADQPLEHRRVGRQGGADDDGHRVGQGLRRHRRGPRRGSSTPATPSSRTANDNFDVTTALIRDSNTVLKGQLASASAIRSSPATSRCSAAPWPASDKDLRQVIDSGSAAATELRTFLEENEVDLGELINNLVTTGEVVVQHLDGIEQILVHLPLRRRGRIHGRLEVAGNGPVRRPLRPDPQQEPHVCNRATRAPTPAAARRTAATADERQRPLRRAGRPEQRPRRPARPARAPAAYRAPVVASYDPETGKVRWGDRPGRRSCDLVVGPTTLGGDSWKWLFLQPLAPRQE